MIPSKRNALLLFALVAALIVMTDAPRARAQSLKAEIRSVKASYLLAEPVFLDITVRNTGDRAVALTPELTVETQNVSLFLARGDEPFQKYEPGLVQEPGHMPVTVAPSQAITQRQLVLFNHVTNDFAFPTAGTYRVRALVHGFNVRPDLNSNELEIRIQAPTVRDAEAAPLFRTRNVAYLVMGMDEPSDAVLNLERLMSEYPATVYGKYAQFYLARRQTHEFFQRKPSFEHAVNLYGSLLERDPSFPLAMQAHYEMGRALLTMGRYDEARHKFDLVVRETHITSLAEGARRSLASIERVPPAELKR